jgi:uncharacterized membrane protein YphA (DoxX/SURF4 family)
MWQPLTRTDWFWSWGLAAVGVVLIFGVLGIGLGSLAGKSRIGLFGAIFCVLALAAGVGLFCLALFGIPDGLAAGLPEVLRSSLGPQATLIGQWQLQQWTYWFLCWGMAAVGVFLVVGGLVQILAHWRDWGRLDWFGWLSCLDQILLGAALLIAGRYFIQQDWPELSRLEQMDWLVIWGVTAVGVCLLLGLLTRTACVLGALLLVLFVLPAWPENLIEAGPFVKNIVEAAALAALATTLSGRWMGVDASLQFLNPWRWLADEAPPPAPFPRVQEREPALAPVGVTLR